MGFDKISEIIYVATKINKYQSQIATQQLVFCIASFSPFKGKGWMTFDFQKSVNQTKKFFATSLFPGGMA